MFHSEDDLTNHKEKGCLAVEGQTIEMPKFDPEKPDKFFVKFNHIIASISKSISK